MTDLSRFDLLDECCLWRLMKHLLRPPSLYSLTLGFAAKARGACQLPCQIQTLNCGVCAKTGELVRFTNGVNGGLTSNKWDGVSSSYEYIFALACTNMLAGRAAMVPTFRYTISVSRIWAALEPHLNDVIRGRNHMADLLRAPAKGKEWDF